MSREEAADGTLVAYSNQPWRAKLMPMRDTVQRHGAVDRALGGCGKPDDENDHEIRRPMSILIGYLLQSPSRLPVYFIVIVPRPCMSMVIVPV